MATVTNTANFGLNERTIEELVGVNIPSSTRIVLFDNQNIDGEGELGFGIGPLDTVSFDYQYNLGLGLDVVIDRFTLGTIDVLYPLDIGLELPDNIQPGETYSIGTSSLVDVNGAVIKGGSFSIGNVGLDLRFSSDGATLDDFALLEIGESNLVDLPIDDVEFSGFDEKSFRLIEFDLSLGQSEEVIDGVELEIFGIPGGGEASSDPLNLSNQSSLPEISVPVDDPLAQISANPIELFDTFPAFAALDFLTEDFGPYNLPGGFEIEFEYTLLAPFISAGFGLIQEFVFTPRLVNTTISLGGEIFEGVLGDSFDFTAPIDADAPLTGSVTYDLEGDISAIYRLAPIGSIGVEVLGGSATFIDSNGNETSANAGPLGDFSIGGSADALSLTLFETGPIEVPDEFFDPISFDFELSPLENTLLRPAQDFYVGTTSNGLLLLDWVREGDLSYSIDILSDGTTLQPDGIGFDDGVITYPANQDSAQVGGVNLNGFVGFPEDILIEVVYSVSPADSPIADLVTFETDTVRYLFIGDGIDDRGGTAFGDPHLISFDNVAFDFQAAGEFVLARATSGAEYEVQARFNAISSAVSVTQAMATMVDGFTISIEANGSTGSILVGDSETTIAVGDSIAVGTGSISRTGQSYLIDHGNGDFTNVDVFSSFLNVSPQPSEARASGTMEGLLGNANGTPADDFRLADGTVLTTPVPIEILYGEFAESWLVSGPDSLLPGDAEEFNAPGRIITIDSLPSELRQSAEAAVDAVGIINPILREAAILDFALTGNAEFIDAATLIDEDYNPIVDTVPVDPVSNPVVVLTSDTNLLDEEDAGSRTATFTVSRGDNEGDLTVNYAIDGTGAAPADAFDLVDGTVNGSVVILDGQETATFEVEVADDDLDEGPETFNVSISLDLADADNFELLVSEVPVTIVDSDEAPALNEVLGTTGRDNLIGGAEDDLIIFNGGVGDVGRGNGGKDAFDLSANTSNGSRDNTRIVDWSDDILLGVSLEDVHQETVRSSNTALRFAYGDDNDVLTITGDVSGGIESIFEIYEVV